MLYFALYFGQINDDDDDDMIIMTITTDCCNQLNSTQLKFNSHVLQTAILSYHNTVQSTDFNIRTN